MMKDAGQKDLLYRHFRAQGWFTMVEVPVAARERAGAQEKLVTDIDVLALRPSPDLGWEVVIGDCKTKKGESPANRALWVRSLMDFMRAARGYLVLRRDRGGIEPDHKLFAAGLGVTLLDEEQFTAFDRAMLYPAGSGRSHNETAAQLREFYADVRSRFGRLEPLVRYLSANAWLESDHFTLMRKIVGITHSVRSEVDPENPTHVGFVLEAASVFAVTVATGVGRAFHQYGLSADRAGLEEGLHVLLWGGRDRYEGVVAVRSELRAAKGVKADDEDSFGLPKWPIFLQLVRSMMDAPRLAFRVAPILRRFAMEMAGVIPPDPRPLDPMVLKFALMTATYFTQATHLPPDMHTRVKDFVLKRVGDAVSRRATHSGHDASGDTDGPAVGPAATTPSLDLDPSEPQLSLRVTGGS